ncbi:hypothetical protein Nepgr_018205 [Nepenthes gracilis]|uniref:Uncharacterized protein n=1 Tax=Nepenthes gracilis TaxID=150966 RepID=A0AAD3XTT8_NEPGR|nr:hypothetical protein Nepgr_018205 [Nepenthes gracilis]
MKKREGNAGAMSNLKEKGKHDQPPMPYGTSSAAAKTKRDDQEKAMEKSRTTNHKNAKALPPRKTNVPNEKAWQTQDLEAPFGPWGV